MSAPTRSSISAGDRLLLVLRDRCRDVVISGGRFPTEPRLAEELGVSRPLLREALSRLEHEGLLRRRRGEATSVNAVAAGIRFWFDRQETFADLFERHGLTVVQDVLSVALAPAGELDRAALGIDASRWVVAVRKRWRADGRVVVVADNFVPVPADMRPEDVVEPEQNMFHLVAELYGEVPEWEVARPTAVVADAALRSAFEIEAPAAVLALRMVGLGVSGAHLYRSIEYYPADGLDWSFVRTFRPV